jgi:hypothetical protein
MEEIHSERSWKKFDWAEVWIKLVMTYVPHGTHSHSRSWALLEESPILQPLGNFPAFYGTRRFITVFTIGPYYHEPRQSNPYHRIASNFNTVHSPMSWSSQWSLSFWRSHQYPICIPLLPHSYHVPNPCHPSWPDHSNYTRQRVQVMKLLIMQFSPTSCHFIPRRSEYSPQQPVAWIAQSV